MVALGPGEDDGRMAPTRRPHILIAGGGVAAVELALALDDLAGPRVRMTLVSPRHHFELRSLRTAEPFSAGHAPRHSLQSLASRVNAELLIDAVSAVEAERHTVRLATLGSLSYDALVLAVGGLHRSAFSRASTFTGSTSTVAYNGLLADLEERWTRSVAFVVPHGVTWPPPLYELALMTARDVRSMCIDDARLRLVSPEATPLAVFGPRASLVVAGLLEDAGIVFTGSSYAQPGDGGRLALLPSGEMLDAERVVALPRIEGPQLSGVPRDGRGFIPVDEHGRVPGLPDVYAAGDATTVPVKQGGIACQQADAIAELLAAVAGAALDPQPFRPILRARLLTGRGAQYLEHRLCDGAAGDPPAELRSWSAADKVDGRYISPWLRELALDSPSLPEPDRSHVDIEVDLDPRTHDAHRDALRLDPYSPTAHAV